MHHNKYHLGEGTEHIEPTNVLSLMFRFCISAYLICQSFHVWCWLAQRSSQESTMKEILHRNYHRECNFRRCFKADLNRHHFLTQFHSINGPAQLKYMRSKPDPWFLLLTCPFCSPSFLLFNLHRHMWTGHFTVTLHSKRWWIFSQLSVVSVRKSPPLGPGKNPQKSAWGGHKGPKEFPRNFNKDQQDVHHSSSYSASP